MGVLYNWFVGHRLHLWRIRSFILLGMGIPLNLVLASSLEPVPPGRLDDSIKSKLFKNAHLIVAKGLTTDFEKSVGPQKIYDLASLTKPFGTALLFAAYWSQGKVSPQSKVTDVLPDFTRFSDVTFEELLTHTSGLATEIPSRLEQKYTKVSQRIGAIRDHALLDRKNRGFNYSDIGYDVLGYALEKIGGKSLSEAVTSEVFTPLGLDNDVKFFAGNGSLPQDEIAAKYYPHALGHAGLFASAHGVLALNQRLFEAAYGLTGSNVWTREVAQAMLRVVSGGRGYAFDFLSPYADMVRGSCYAKGESFGHSGYVGTSIWTEPSSRNNAAPRTIVLLTDTTIIDRSEKSRASLNQLRHELATWACRNFKDDEPSTVLPKHIDFGILNFLFKN